MAYRGGADGDRKDGRVERVGTREFDNPLEETQGGGNTVFHMEVHLGDKDAREKLEKPGTLPKPVLLGGLAGY